MTPTYASRDIFQIRQMTADASTDAESTASKRASEPEATSAPELTFSPCALTYAPSISFTTMATAIITSVSAL